MAVDWSLPPIGRYLQILAAYQVTARLDGGQLKLVGPQARLAAIKADIPHLRDEIVAYLESQQRTSHPLPDSENGLETGVRG